MASAQVLVVDVEEAMAEAVAHYLRQDGHDVLVVHDGAAELDVYREFDPDLIVLDRVLSRLDGLAVYRRIRAMSDRPIIVLTEADEAAEPLLGADDGYFRKPFTARELAAHAQAVLRGSRSANFEGALLRFGNVAIDGRTRTVTAGARAIPLTATEFDLIHFLARHPGRVFTRGELLEAIWDHHAVTGPNTITVHIRRIRTKLEANPSRPRYVRTVWGVGYKLDP